MKNNASLTYNLLLVLGDIGALIVAFMAAFIIRANSTIGVAHEMEWQTYGVMFASLLPFWILIFALLGLYHSSLHERRFAEIGRLFLGSFIGLLFMVFWDYMSLTTIFPAKLVPIYGFLIGFVLLVGFRTVARLIRTSLFAYGIGLNRIVLVGNTPMTLELVESLTHKQSGYNIVGVIGYRRQLPQALQAYPNFTQFLASYTDDLHGIVQTELYANEERNAELLNYAQEHHVSYRFVPGNSELFVGNIDVDLFRNSIPVIQVHHTALFGWGRVVKRLTDIFLGGLLLVLSLPLWLCCALLIKLTDPHGPVFYKAKRLSRFGSTIGVYKFRTMKQAYNNMSPEEGFAVLGQPELARLYRKNGDHLPNDPRISRIGRLLRATSLDELPQIWNVVHGEISLVGPRALDVYEMERYDKKNLILSVKSGLTGLAIVSGREGIPFEERRKLDLYYVQNWSFWLDLVIIFKTARVVLGRLVRHGARYR